MPVGRPTVPGGTHAAVDNSVATPTCGIDVGAAGDADADLITVTKEGISITRLKPGSRTSTTGGSCRYQGRNLDHEIETAVPAGVTGGVWIVTKEGISITRLKHRGI